MKLASSQLWLQQVSGIHGTFRFSGTDDVVNFIDEQDNLAIGFVNFIQNRFQSFLEFTPVFRTGNQRTHIQREDGLVLQVLRNISVHNSLCQSLDNGGFAHTRLTNQYRVIFGPSGQDFDGPADFFISSDYRIQLSLPCGFYQIDTVLIEGIVAVLRILVGYTLISSNHGERLQELILVDAVSAHQLFRLAVAGTEDGQVGVFHADVFIFEFRCDVLRIHQHLVQLRRKIYLAAADLWQFLQTSFQILLI